MQFTYIKEMAPVFVFLLVPHNNPLYYYTIAGSRIKLVRTLAPINPRTIDQRLVRAPFLIRTVGIQLPQPVSIIPTGVLFCAISRKVREKNDTES